MISLSSGSSRRLREADEAPGCLPGLRPDLVRDDRFCAGFFAHGASEEGGRDQFEESAASRRSSSATRSVNAATMRVNSSCPARNSAFSARNAAFSATSRTSGAKSGTTTPCPTQPKDQLDTPRPCHSSLTSNNSTS
jgi:hypothetical protein